MDTVENNFLLLDMDLYLNTIYFHTWSWHVIQVKFKLVWTLGVTFLSTQIRDAAQAAHPFISVLIKTKEYLTEQKWSDNVTPTEKRTSSYMNKVNI